MYNYANAYIPADFSAEILSVEWLLSPSSNVSLAYPTSSGVKLVVSGGGIIETVELQCRVTFIYGVIKTGTKQIHLSTDTNWVYLGLPSGLLWRNRNLNADVETDSGDYFQWGDTVGHAKDSGYDFSLANYEDKGLNNINSDLTLAQDAANVYLGGACRMPTRFEFQELYDNCTKEWVTENGVKGWRFTSNINGNSIFFPAAGNFNGTSLNNVNLKGDYWSKSYSSETAAYKLLFDSENVSPQYPDYRRFGFSIRAVKPTS